jgi:hypothetical protein
MRYYDAKIDAIDAKIIINKIKEIISLNKQKRTINVMFYLI